MPSSGVSEFFFMWGTYPTLSKLACFSQSSEFGVPIYSFLSDCWMNRRLEPALRSQLQLRILFLETYSHRIGLALLGRIELQIRVFTAQFFSWQGLNTKKRAFLFFFFFPGKERKWDRHGQAIWEPEKKKKTIDLALDGKSSFESPSRTPIMFYFSFNLFH